MKMLLFSFLFLLILCLYLRITKQSETSINSNLKPYFLNDHKFQRLQKIKEIVLHDEENVKKPFEEKLALTIRSDLFLFSEGLLCCYVLLNACVDPLIETKYKRTLRIQNLIILAILKIIYIYTDVNDKISNDLKFNPTNLSNVLSTLVQGRQGQNLAYIVHSNLFGLSSWPILIQYLPFIVRWLSIYILSTISYDHPNFIPYRDFLSQYLLPSFNNTSNSNSSNSSSGLDVDMDVDADIITRSTYTEISSSLLSSFSVEDICYIVSNLIQIGYAVNTILSFQSSNQKLSFINSSKIWMVPIYGIFLWQYFGCILQDPSISNLSSILSKYNKSIPKLFFSITKKGSSKNNEESEDKSEVKPMKKKTTKSKKKAKTTNTKKPMTI